MTNFTSPYLEPATPQVIQPSPVQTPSATPESPSKRSYKIISLILIPVLAILAMITLYVMTQARTMYKEASATPTPMPSPIASADPTATWQTYTSTDYGFTFKYPLDNKVSEKVPGYYVITKQDESVPQAGVSIEARMSGPYEAYDTAKKYFTDSFINSETSVSGMWEIFQGKGKDGMLKGVEFRSAITKYKTGAIEVEVLANTDYINQFDQILSTFKFAESNTNPTESLIKSAIVDTTYTTNKVAGISRENINVTITKISGDYAMGTVSVNRPEGQPGQVWYATHHDGKWTQIWAGQEPPSCELMTEWKFPQNIFECAK